MQADIGLSTTRAICWTIVAIVAMLIGGCNGWSFFNDKMAADRNQRMLDSGYHQEMQPKTYEAVWVPNEP